MQIREQDSNEECCSCILVESETAAKESDRTKSAPGMQTVENKKNLGRVCFEDLNVRACDMMVLVDIEIYESPWCIFFLFRSNAYDQ